MIQIDKQLIQQLLDQSVVNPRLRQSCDLRTEATDIELEHKDNSQRILKALMPGTKVPVHRHPHSNESVILLCGKVVEVIYEEVDDVLSGGRTAWSRSPSWLPYRGKMWLRDGGCVR